MSVINDKFEIISKGFDDIIDITAKVENIVSLNNISGGIVNIFSVSSCASIITLELEPALGEDLLHLLDSIIPVNKLYKHDTLWHDGNAYSNLKASVLGNGITLNISGNKLQLGQYQRVYLIDFDNKPSTREISVSIVY